MNKLIEDQEESDERSAELETAGPAVAATTTNSPAAADGGGRGKSSNGKHQDIFHGGVKRTSSASIDVTVDMMQPNGKMADMGGHSSSSVTHL